jgi:hypothetical protein
MNIVTAHGPVQEWLSRIVEPAEVRDSSGNLLGYFTPRTQSEAQLYARAAELFDPVEMRHRKETEKEGYTIEQVMEHLKSLETSG